MQADESFSPADLFFEATLLQAKNYDHIKLIMGEKRHLVAEAPWNVAEWAVALSFDNPGATVPVRLLGDTPSTSVWVRNALTTIEDHPIAFRTCKN